MQETVTLAFVLQ